MATRTTFGAAPEAVLKEHAIKSDNFTLLLADFCPFANRAWIAILEKEDSPQTPTLFDHVQVCYPLGPEKDSGTNLLYGLGLKSVPTAVYKGQILSESADVADFIDDLFPNKSPLKPVDPVMKFNMTRFMSSHSQFLTAMYSSLMNQDASLHGQKFANFFDALQKIEKDLGTFDGPYYCGEQFTLADINVFPFFERAVMLLPHYKAGYRAKLSASEFPNVFKWYQAVQQRPTIQIVMSTRSSASLNTHCAEKTDREEYMQEMYEPYAKGEIALFKEYSVANGRPGFNAYRDAKKKQKAALADTKISWGIMTYAFCVGYALLLQSS